MHSIQQLCGSSNLLHTKLQHLAVFLRVISKQKISVLHNLQKMYPFILLREITTTTATPV